MFNIPTTGSDLEIFIACIPLIVTFFPLSVVILLKSIIDILSDILQSILKKRDPILYEKIKDCLNSVLNFKKTLLLISLIWAISGLLYFNHEMLFKLNIPNLSSYYGLVISLFVAFVAPTYHRKIIEKREISKQSLILHNDIKSSLKILSEAKKNIFSNKTFPKELPKLNTNDKWRENYGYISSLLTDKHYDLISHLYQIFSQYNHAVVNGDSKTILKYMNELFPSYSLPSLNSSEITLRKLLEDLKRLMEKKNINNNAFKILYQELVYRSQKKKISIDIEEVTTKYFTENINCTVDDFSQYISKTFRVQVRKGVYMYYRYLGEITNDVLSTSDKIPGKFKEFRFILKEHDLT